MQLSWRPRAPREFDYELVWLTVSLASLCAAAIWLTLNFPWPQCLFRTVTGLPCVTCGATRSALQFFHGNFAAALMFNPLAFVVYCGLTIFDIYALVVLITRGPRLRVTEISAAEKKIVRTLVVLLLVANWSYLLWIRPL
jgi:hypothetical protein